MPHPRKQEPLKVCAHCGKPLERKRYGGRLEDLGVFQRRKYCDPVCMGRARLQDNVSLAALRKRAVKFRKGQCEQCGVIENVQVHHLDSNPANNEPSNLMTLCGPCHTKWHWEHGKTIPKQSA